MRVESPKMENESGQQRVSELPETTGNGGYGQSSILAQQSPIGTIGNNSPSLAMQKVVGSSPIIRSKTPAKLRL